MLPSTKRKNWSKEAKYHAVRIVRSGDTGYLGASKYFSLPRANSGEVKVKGKVFPLQARLWPRG